MNRDAKKAKTQAQPADTEVEVGSPPVVSEGPTAGASESGLSPEDRKMQIEEAGGDANRRRLEEAKGSKSTRTWNISIRP